MAGFGGVGPFDGDVLTTLHFPRRRPWVERADVVGHQLSSVARVRQLVSRAGRYPVVVLDGAWRADQLAAAAISRRRRPPAIVITDCTWGLPPYSLERAACRLGMRMVDGPHLTYCVLSTAELESFPATWGVDPERVVYTPFYYTADDDDLPGSLGGTGVFAGGDSLRDHEPLIQVARRRPAVPFTIATRRLGERPDLPPNVRAGPLPGPEFVRLMAGAEVVVVPLAAGIDRSAGQQTYLNAMAMGKAVIVTDSPGVRDYVEHLATGLIVPPGEAALLGAALDWALDPENAATVQGMRRRAREVAAAFFNADAYVATLLEVVDRAVQLSPVA